jgi:NAD(P)-dependent dehydrogenase (short-subunit alcohol dehydrogenase family)
MSRAVLITGCSSGFGRELVPAFLERGWTVIATLRGLRERAPLFAAEQAKHPGRLVLLELDVTSAAQRAAIVGELGTYFGGKLDLLVNNAGYGLFGALEDLSEAQLRDQMEVNFFGLSLLIRELLPALRRSRGRIINLSSVMGYSALPLSSAYCASKYAVEGLSESLYYELGPQGIQVALVEPGRHRTSFGAKLVWGEGSHRDESPYALQSRNYRRLRERLSSGREVPSTNVIRAVLRLAGARRMPLRTRCGRDAAAMALLKRILSDGILARLLTFLYGRLFLRQVTRG